MDMEIDNESLPIDRRERVLMPFLSLDFRSARKRVMDFREVVVPFDEERAKYEARRCIHCPDPPCVSACPLHNQIPSAMWLVENGNYQGGALIFRLTSNMPRVCGRICPQEYLCEGSCVLNKNKEPVHIGALEAWMNDITDREGVKPGFKPVPSGKKVAVVGAGPAGLSCTDQLIAKGHSVTVFDARPRPGGLLMYGIPGFKLTKQILYDKLEQLEMAGVTFINNTLIGESKTVDGLLKEGFDAVFIGIGTGIDSPMKIPGEDVPGVYKATEFLIRANVDPKLLPQAWHGKPEVGRRVMVIGGGDTSTDCVRTARRLGAQDVTCLYRRSEAEMRGNTKDRALARQEGTQYMFLVQPVKFIAGENGKLSAVECTRMELGEPDARGRRRPVPVNGTNFLIDTDTAVLALGYLPFPTIAETTPGLETDEEGMIIADPSTGATSRPGVFAGGDAVNGPDLVVTAVASGRTAASGIDNFLRTQA